MPASTIARRVSMLELLSTTRPTATGESPPLNIVIVCGVPSSTTWKTSRVSCGTGSPRRSNTVTCRTTRSDSLEKVGRAGSCAPGAGSWPRPADATPTAVPASTSRTSARAIVEDIGDDAAFTGRDTPGP